MIKAHHWYNQDGYKCYPLANLEDNGQAFVVFKFYSRKRCMWMFEVLPENQIKRGVKC